MNNRLFTELSSFTRSSVAKALGYISFCIFFVLQIIGQQAHAETTKIRIAVAANFHPVLTKIAQNYPDKTVELELIAGATGTLFQQIYHGAPFDIFLSADTTRPEKLEELALIEQGSRITYAKGELAFWSATHNIQNLDDVKQLITSGRVAIANPKIAPYGKAAFQALTNLLLWQQVNNKRITGINIGQTFAQTRSQAAQIGIIANSQLVLNNLTGYKVPCESYDAIEQQLVILKSSENLNASKQFVEYLLSASIQQQIVAMGYQGQDNG